MSKSAIRWSRASGSTKRRVEIIVRRGCFRKKSANKHRRVCEC